MMLAAGKERLSRSRVLLVTVSLAVLLHGLGFASLRWEMSPVVPSAAPRQGIAVDLHMPSYAAPSSLPEPQPVSSPLENPPALSEDSPTPSEEPPVPPPSVASPVVPVPQPQTPPRKPKPRTHQTVASVTSTQASPGSGVQATPSASVASHADAPASSDPLPLASHARVRPEYPDISRKRGQEGLVRVLVHVDEKGIPEEAAVAQSSGFSLLDEAALKAVRKWRFTPGLRNGVPVRGRAIVPVEFRLQ